MKPKILPRIEQKLEHEGIAQDIADKLTLSEINSFLMEVHRLKSHEILASDLLSSYTQNRFVKPSDIDPLKMMDMKTRILTSARENGFMPIDLSPLVPFGCCSAMAPISQDNIVTALRGTEVLSDLTNALCLEASRQRRENDSHTIHLCAAEKVVRAQAFDNPKFSAHFQLFAMISAGRDKGNFQFEKQCLEQHIRFYLRFLKSVMKSPDLQIHFIPIAEKGGTSRRTEQILEGFSDSIFNVPVQIEESKENFSYYSDVRMSMYLKAGGQSHMIIDGGFTDWTSQLLSNRKERLFTSGLGLEYLMRILS